MDFNILETTYMSSNLIILCQFDNFLQICRRNVKEYAIRNQIINISAIYKDLMNPLTWLQFYIMRRWTPKLDKGNRIPILYDSSVPLAEGEQPNWTREALTRSKVIPRPSSLFITSSKISFSDKGTARCNTNHTLMSEHEAISVKICEHKVSTDS